jgi:hypothetical protein
MIAGVTQRYGGIEQARAMIVHQYLGHASQAPLWRIGWTDMRLAPAHIMPGALLDISRKSAPVLLQDRDVLPGVCIRDAVRKSVGRQHTSYAQQQGFGG